MAIKPQVRADQILDGHPGLTGKSQDNTCITDYFPEGSYRYTDCSEILDGTVEVDGGTHTCTEGELFVYRACGMTACHRQIGMIIDAGSRVVDAQPFVAPCTGKPRVLAE